MTFQTYKNSIEKCSLANSEKREQLFKINFIKILTFWYNFITCSYEEKRPDFKSWLQEAPEITNSWLNHKRKRYTESFSQAADFFFHTITESTDLILHTIIKSTDFFFHTITESTDLILFHTITESTDLILFHTITESTDFFFHTITESTDLFI